MSGAKEEQPITKAETSDGKSVVRPFNLTREKGQPRVVTSSHYIQRYKEADLAMPRWLCTADNMMKSAPIYNSVDYTNLLVLMSLSKGKFVGKKGSIKSEESAKFLNYNIRNMSYGTWMQAMNHACTDLTYGFSLLSLVLEQRNYGPYKGSFCLKRLGARDPHSLYGWVWDKNYRYLKGFVQKPNLVSQREPNERNFINGGITTLQNARQYKADYPYTKMEQCLHFAYNPTMNNPQGNSPLMACYSSWLELTLVSRYEVVGVSKDMGGALVLRLPKELIQRANQPDIYPEEAAEYQSLLDNAAALHAGEETYIVLSSEVDPSTKMRDYDISFEGVNGGGKQYKTSEIISEKKKEIYNNFGTGFFLLGQDASGSYAKAEVDVNTHSFYVDRNVAWKKDVIENQLATRLLSANDIFLDYDDMPEFIPADVSEASLDEIGKFIQRVASVVMLTPEALETLYNDLGLPTEGIDKIDFTDKGESRAGESKGSSGTGDKQSGGANSATNVENKSISLKLLEDDGFELTLKDSNGKLHFIDKEKR